MSMADSPLHAASAAVAAEAAADPATAPGPEVVRPEVVGPEVVGVHVLEPGLARNLRAIRIVWQRELIRFVSDRLRLASSLVQPLLWLFVLGTGLSRAISPTGAAAGGVDLRTFMFPGVLAMTVLFTAVFSAASIVFDREFGFLREMLVAPVSRTAIVLGKCLGGATVATLQGIMVLALAGLVGVPYDPVLLLTLVAEMLLLAFTLTAFGVMAAARIRSIQAFMPLVQMFLMPMFFLSGALYPITNLPAWLQVITHVNPLTYAVDPMRHAVFSHLEIARPALDTLSPGVPWGSWVVPVGLELAVVALMGLVMLAIGIVQFRRAE
jgi:ABC-2 type transport system permease protein